MIKEDYDSYGKSRCIGQMKYRGPFWRRSHDQLIYGRKQIVNGHIRIIAHDWETGSKKGDQAYTSNL